jgi:hypothetical protein
MLAPTPQSALERAARLAWPQADPAVARADRISRARRKGAIQSVVGVALAALLAWRFGRLPAAIAGAVAAVTLILAWASPLGGFARLERGLQRLGAAIGTAIAWALMTPFFYLILTPLGLLLRARGKLRIRRRPDPRLASYWTALPSTKPDYERQF